MFNEDDKLSVLKEHVAGIFSIGEQSIDTQNDIKKLQDKSTTARQAMQDVRTQIGFENDPASSDTLYGKIASLRVTARDDLFTLRDRFPETSRKIFFTHSGHKEYFFAKEVLPRYEGFQDLGDVPSIDDIEKRASSLYSAEARRTLPVVSVASLLTTPDIDFLKKTIEVPSHDEFSKFIDSLGNAQWVSDGLKYFTQESHLCPFCQGTTPPGLYEKLVELFSGEYADAVTRIEELLQTTHEQSITLEAELAALETALDADSDISKKPFQAAIKQLRTDIDLLSSRLDNKKQNIATSVGVEDITLSIQRIRGLLTEENIAITNHNKVVDNAKQSKDQLVQDGWQLFLSMTPVQNALKQYVKQTEYHRKAIKKQNEDIETARAEIQECAQEISELQSSISNTQEVADRINCLLKGSGFTRFSITPAPGEEGNYQIVRADGTLAFDTLSEGEKSFLCFLYYWESLFGKTEPGSDAEPVIAVIDDPISSLDSDVLFIVSSFIRDACRLAKEKKGTLRQLIVLTHNTQFHHEASYQPGGKPSKTTKFYRLMKRDSTTTHVVDDGVQSTIQGTYALLWQSVVEAARSQHESDLIRVGIYNTVRRIIESYFKTIGPTKPFFVPDNYSVTDRRRHGRFRYLDQRWFSHHHG